MQRFLLSKFTFLYIATWHKKSVKDKTHLSNMIVMILMAYAYTCQWINLQLKNFTKCLEVFTSYINKTQMLRKIWCYIQNSRWKINENFSIKFNRPSPYCSINAKKKRPLLNPKRDTRYLWFSFLRIKAEISVALTQSSIYRLRQKRIDRLHRGNTRSAAQLLSRSRKPWGLPLR